MTQLAPHGFPVLPFLTVAPGVEMRVLRRDEAQGMTFVIRMAEGARAPLHEHPGGEETYVLSGTLRIEHRLDAGGHALPDLALAEGDYACVEPGETHDGVAVEACVFFVVARGGVALRSGASARADAP